MAYADDIAADYHKVGFYIRFRGIPTRISTHDPADWANWNPSETFAAVIIKDSLSGLSETLNREGSFVEQGSLSWEVMATTAMISLFAHRGGTEDPLNGAVSASGVTFTVLDNIAPTSGVAYVDRETVNITGFSGSDRTVTRGYEDSVAVPHATGAVLSTQPRFWFTRRFTLFAVNLETGTESELFTGSLDASPQFSDGKFSFSGSGVINDYLKRPLHTGWEVLESTDATASGETLELTLNDTTGVTTPGYLRLVGDSGTLISGGFVLGWAPGVTATTVTVYNAGFVAGDVTAPTDMDGESVSLEQVTVVTGTPGQIAAQAIVSVEGDQNNGYWDWLIGVRADAAGSDELFRDLRMGAGIPAADVDVDSFATRFHPFDVATWLDEEIELGEFLARECLPFMGGYVYCTPAGVLTHRQYTSNAVRAGLTAYTPDDVLTSNVTTFDDESGWIARVEIECNYRPVDRQYLRKIDLNFRDERALFGDIGESLSFKSKSINIGESLEGVAATHLFSTPSRLSELEATFDRQRAWQSWAGRRMSLRLPWRHHNTFTVGYRFSWTDTRMIDHEGGTGVSGRYYEVTGRQLDLGTGEVFVECDEVPSGTLLCPSAFVSSWDGGTQTITLDTTTDLHDSAPGSDFAADWYVSIYDASANFATVEIEEVSSVTSSTIVLKAAPSGFTPAAGDLVVLSQSDDRGNTNDVSADVEDFAFAADASFTVGASSNTGPRWS